MGRNYYKSFKLQFSLPIVQAYNCVVTVFNTTASRHCASQCNEVFIINNNNPIFTFYFHPPPAQSDYQLFGSVIDPPL